MSRSPSASDKTHIKDCGLIPTKVSSWCGAGAGHDVYEYGETQVVKIPKIRWIKEKLSIITAEDAKRSLRIIETHFREFSLRSSVHASAKGNSYCILQQKLDKFENLTSAHLRSNKRLADQLNDILRRNKQLAEQKGAAIDFLGREGCVQMLLSSVFFGTPQMANLVVVGHGPSAQIFIVDSNTFSLKRRKEKCLPRKLMADSGKCCHVVTNYMVNNAFGSHIQPETKS